MEQRRTKRFQLQLPLSITRSGSERVAYGGLTSNISSSGVLFVSSRAPDTGGPIEYVITLGSDEGRTVNLRCMGKVVRTEPLGREYQEGPEGFRSFEVAATLERYEFVRP